jgi:hypothetical protein
MARVVGTGGAEAVSGAEGIVGGKLGACETGGAEGGVELVDRSRYGSSAANAGWLGIDVDAAPAELVDGMAMPAYLASTRGGLCGVSVLATDCACGAANNFGLPYAVTPSSFGVVEFVHNWIGARCAFAAGHGCVAGGVAG